MAQDYVDNVYDSTFEVQTTMANVEKNFAALKSSFSGAGAPSNPIAGMWWFDTTANILKLRNEANNAWQSVWDFANNKPVIANLSNEITAAMLNSALKSPAAGTEGLRTLGTGAAQALPGNTDYTPADNSITIAKMQHGSIMLPFTGSGSTNSISWVAASGGGRLYIPVDATTIKMTATVSNGAGTAYARFVISTVTSSESGSGGGWIYTTADVSALSGWLDLILQIKSNSTGATATLSACSFVWE